MPRVYKMREMKLRAKPSSLHKSITKKLRM